MFTACDKSENKSLSKKGKFFPPHFLLVFSFKTLNSALTFQIVRWTLALQKSQKRTLPAPCSLTSVGEHPNPKLICHKNMHLMDLLLDLVICFTWTNLPDLVMKGRLFMNHNICHAWLRLVLPAEPPPKPKKHSVQYTPFQLRWSKITTAVFPPKLHRHGFVGKRAAPQTWPTANHNCVIHLPRTGLAHGRRGASDAYDFHKASWSRTVLFRNAPFFDI